MLQRDSSHEIIRQRKAGSLLQPQWCNFPQTELHSRECFLKKENASRATTAFNYQGLEGVAGPRLVVGGTWLSLGRWLVLSEYHVPENYYYYRVLKILPSKQVSIPSHSPTTHFVCHAPCPHGTGTIFMQEEWLYWCLVGLSFYSDNNEGVWGSALGMGTAEIEDEVNQHIVYWRLLAN